MPFKSMPNAQQGALFDAGTLPPADRRARRFRMLPLGAIIGAAQAAHQLGDEAPWPVWGGSTRKPVPFSPCRGVRPSGYGMTRDGLSVRPEGQAIRTAR